MKIEPNKFYQTRDKRKVRIYAVDGEGTQAIHGSILVDNSWRLVTWYANGMYAHELDPPNCKDIVSEWEEPVPVPSNSVHYPSVASSKQKEKKPRMLAYLVYVDDGNAGPKYAVGFDDHEGRIDRRAPWLDEPEEE